MSCSICWEEFRAEPSNLLPYTLPCSHSYHEKCIKDSAQGCGQRCPICRQEYPDMVSVAKLNIALAGRIEKNQNEPIQIFLKDINGKSIPMFVCLSDKENNFHSIVSKMTGISEAELRLTTGTKNINAKGERMLHELNIQNIQLLT